MARERSESWLNGWRRLALCALVTALPTSACGFPTFAFEDGASTDDAGGDAMAGPPTDAPMTDANGLTDADSTVEVAPTVDAAHADASEADAKRDGATDGSPYPAPTVCSGASSVSFCSAIVVAPGPITIDGRGDDMCGVAPRTFLAKDADFLLRSDATYTPPESVSVRAALDASGVYVFVQVLGDPAILVAPGTAGAIAAGDAVEIYLRGYRSGALDGKYGDDGALEIVVTPPTATSSPRAERYVMDAPMGAYDDGAFAAVLVDGGYQVELFVPWSALPAEPANGQSLGFDVGVDIADDPSTKSRQARAVMNIRTLSGSSNCGPILAPWCDDRVFCQVNAYGP
jgi:hypothetical protein